MYVMVRLGLAVGSQISSRLLAPAHEMLDRLLDIGVLRLVLQCYFLEPGSMTGVRRRVGVEGSLLGKVGGEVSHSTGLCGTGC